MPRFRPSPTRGTAVLSASNTGEQSPTEAPEALQGPSRGPGDSMSTRRWQPSAVAIRTSLRRVFIVGWLVAGLAGALNHGIALKVLGHRFDLVLPHLRYGYVMFNHIPRDITVVQYLTPSGEKRLLSDLVDTPALGYESARLSMDAMNGRRYLEQICRSASGRSLTHLRLISEEYEISPGQSRQRGSAERDCGTPSESDR